MAKTIDMTGQRFGRLVVVEYAGRANNRQALWRCKCDCGGEKTTIGCSLRKGLTQSCGCIAREKVRANNTARLRTHGRSKTRHYANWREMIARCHDPEHKNYQNYGARGIYVCARWRESYENFLADMGERPAGMTLDRIDNNGPYSPENCRWADDSTQHNNTRQNRRVTFDGRTQTVTQWARERGLPWERVFGRIYRGWTPERALELN